MKKLTVRLTFIEEILGTASGDPKLHATYIASKAPDAKTLAEEIKALGAEAVEKKQMTLFPRMGKKPFIWNYQVKGFFKAACQACREIPKSKSQDLSAFRKKIDQLIFVRDRQIPLKLPAGETLGVCTRPLRASTPQGERIALASSESAPAGSTVEFTIIDLSERLGKAIIEWLDYGEFSGLLQWRNSGKGAFTYIILKGST
jgi:hypothetical protein